MSPIDSRVEISSLTAVLGLELIVALLLIIVFMLWRKVSSDRDDHAKASSLVARINTEHSKHLEKLGGQLFDAVANFPVEKRELSMAALATKENELYRHVIRAFLAHDMEKLAELDQYVHGLSEPYCQLITALLEHLPKQQSAENSTDGETVEQRLQVAETVALESQAKSEQINHQLTLALSTLDEVSSEYTKIFNEPKTVEEHFGFVEYFGVFAKYSTNPRRSKN